ncbi:hypothetical protein [Janibacter sp. LM]|uniref:phage tail tube protein n=1 Tax=Janibacter sp. LM TaxID=3144845 RepID=UPI0031F7132B
MALNQPVGVPALGTLSLTIIPVSGVANIAALTVTEATALGAINASCHNLSDGWGRSRTQQSATRRRACSTTTYQVAGQQDISFDAARFVYDPQDPTAEVSKVYAGLTEGEEYYVIERIGVSGFTELAAADYYDAYHVRLDVKDKLVPGDEGELEFTAQFSNLSPKVVDAQIAAAAAAA